MQAKPIVLFDGVCNFCDASVQFIIRRDPNAHFRFAALQSEIGRRVLTEQGLDPNDLNSMILIEDGQCYTKSDAALRITRRLSGLWPLLSLFRVVPRILRNWVYDRIARNRYRWFGRKEACVVPTPEMRARFLE